VNYELGTAFTSVTAGQIAAVRFWKASSETGTHTGRIWSSTGQLLTSVVFTNETASGWQQQTLPAPLSIAANTTYIVSVNTGNSFYVATQGGLTSQVINGDLRSVVGGNGRYGSPGQFPTTNSFFKSNYFRDIVFLSSGFTNLGSVSLSPASVTGGTSSTGTVTLTSPALAGGAEVVLASDNAAATVPDSVTVAAGASTATFSVDTSAVGTTTSVNILGSYNGFQSATLTINPPVLSTVSLSPASVVGGGSSTGTVSLTGPAPIGGAVVTLLSDDASATVPASVTVAPGATTATFPVTTTPISASTSANILGSYGGFQSATLTINPASLSALSLNPASVTGGTSSTGTVTLNGPAPAGGALVTLSSDGPVVAGIDGVSTPDGLPQDGSVDWADLGPSFTELPSGTVVPVAGLPGLSMTVSTATGLPLLTLTQCPGDDCGWEGNFTPGASLLYTGGSDPGDGSWVGNVPLTVTFSSPQSGVGFHIQPDFTGLSFTATLCAYDSTETLLGCVPFSGESTEDADGSAIFVGLYNDAQEISKVTIHAGGSPYGLTIGDVTVANGRRQMVPAGVTVAAGATTATFTVASPVVPAATVSDISATMNGETQTATLTVTP
jgi:hypothetical protein